jgi:hypothetical protein
MTLRALTPKFAMFAAPRRVLFAASEHVPRHLSRAQRLAPRLYSTEADASSKTDDAKASNGEATATANATGNKAAAPKQAPRSSRTTSYSSGSRNSSSYKAGASSRKLASYSKPAAPSEPAQQADLEDSSESRPPRQSIYTPNLAQYDPPDKLPEDCTASSQVDWANSFFGISVQPATHKQFKQLSQPVHIEDIEVKPDGVIYLPEIKYRRKLNEVFGPMGWGLIPKGEPVVGSNIVTREYALIINGRYVSLLPGLIQLLVLFNSIYTCFAARTVTADPSFQIRLSGARREQLLLRRPASFRRRRLQIQRSDALLQGPRY